MTDRPARPQDTRPQDTRAQDAHDEDHGHSVAAWSAVGVILLGCLLMSVAVVMSTVWLFVAGGVVVVVGVVLGKVLSAMGFGQAAKDNDPAGIA
jgi:type IV secretory pathway TrbF-like protein